MAGWACLVDIHNIYLFCLILVMLTNESDPMCVLVHIHVLSSS